LSGNLRHRETVGPDGASATEEHYYYYYYYYFTPGTQFPGNEKNYAMQYKKSTKIKLE